MLSRFSKRVLASAGVGLSLFVLAGCGGTVEEPVTQDEAARQNQITQQGVDAQASTSTEAARQNAVTAGGSSDSTKSGATEGK